MDRKWTYLMFVVGGMLLAYLLTRSGLWAWDYLATSDFAGDYVGKPKDLLIDAFGVGAAGLCTLAALRNERLVELANEVTAELRKVTWPTREETVAATIVVIVTVIVASIFLGLFDLLWSWVARLIYG
jgi:preprotein translocase subunit SecE